LAQRSPQQLTPAAAPAFIKEEEVVRDTMFLKISEFLFKHISNGEQTIRFWLHYCTYYKDEF